MSARRDAIFALALWKVRGAFPAQTLADSADHAFALELVGAVLRHKASLEWRVRRCVERLPEGELWAALMVGAAQLFCLPAVPDHAAVAETVEASKPIGRGAARFVNAVLRRLQRERGGLEAALAVQPEHLRRDVPKQLWTRWCAAFGEGQTRALADAMAAPPRVCVRPLPPFGAPTGCTPHPDDPSGTFVVPRGVRVETLEGFSEGRFVVQDAATRHAIDLLEVHPGLRVLDACAAPGGKTAQIAARLAGKGTLVANEPQPDRAARLRDTLARCGALPHVRVIECDARAWPEGERFDRILLDVPCSNTGVFGRRPDARWTWSKHKLSALLETQVALLEACVALLAPGGRLVYSTCSIEPEEDADQVSAFLSRHPDFTLESFVLDFPTPLHDGAYAALFMRR